MAPKLDLGDAGRALRRSGSMSSIGSGTMRNVGRSLDDLDVGALAKAGLNANALKKVQKDLGEMKSFKEATKEQLDSLQKAFDASKISKTSKGLTFGRSMAITAVVLGGAYVGKKLYDQNKKVNYSGNIKKIRAKGSNKAEVTYDPSISMNKKDKVILEQTNSTVTLDGTHDIVPLTRVSFEVAGKNITSEGDQGKMTIEPSSITEDIGQDVKDLTGDILEGILDTLGLAEWGTYIKWGFSASLCCVLCVIVVLLVMKFTSGGDNAY